MKFAHEFEAALSQGGALNLEESFADLDADLGLDFPSDWVGRAVPYSRLKKILKKVQGELCNLGLYPDTLRQLLDANSQSPLALKYKLLSTRFLRHFPGSQLTNPSLIQGTESDNLRPRLTVSVHVRDGHVVDSLLSPSSRAFLQRIASQLPCDTGIFVLGPSPDPEAGGASTLNSSNEYVVPSFTHHAPSTITAALRSRKYVIVSAKGRCVSRLANTAQPRRKSGGHE